jgi:hypothetical protein
LVGLPFGGLFHFLAKGGDAMILTALEILVRVLAIAQLIIEIHRLSKDKRE